MPLRTFTITVRERSGRGRHHLSRGDDFQHVTTEGQRRRPTGWNLEGGAAILSACSSRGKLSPPVAAGSQGALWLYERSHLRHERSVGCSFVRLL